MNRYLVICNYPLSSYPKGTVIYDDKTTLGLDNFPDVFRRLNWYEHLTDIEKEDLRYFKHTKTNEVFKGILDENSLLEAPNGDTSQPREMWYVTTYCGKYWPDSNLSDFEISTEAEYLAYLQSK